MVRGMVRGGAAVILSVSLFLMAMVFPAGPAGAQTGYATRAEGSGSSPQDFLYSIDMQTGLATKIGPAGGFMGVESFTFDPGCKTLYGVDDVTDQLVTCDVQSGTCTAVGPLGVDITDTGLAFGADGILYMSTDAPKPSKIYKLDPKTGAATLLGAQGQEVTGLAADKTGLYGLGGDGRDNLVKIDTATGHATVIGPLKTVVLVDGGIDFDAGGALWGIHPGSVGRVGHSQTLKIDTATGAATIVAQVKDAAGGSYLDGFKGLAIADGVCKNLLPPPPPPPPNQGPTEIPTLAAWGLAALALVLTACGVLVLRRR
jgi:hypothetical protein